MIFVVSKYENWSRYWFNEFASRCPDKSVKERNRMIKLKNGCTVQFMGETTFNNNVKLGMYDDVIYWGESDRDVDRLEQAITGACDPNKIRRIPATQAYTYTLCKEKKNNGWNTTKGLPT